MNINIISTRLKTHNPKTKTDEENALREIAQEIALSALARTDFFKHAAFMGGACLRIFHELHRFSEDLDFWTLQQTPAFAWKTYLDTVRDEFKAYGFQMLIEDRAIASARIKRAFMKKDSIGKVLTLSHTRSFAEDKKLKIKFEIDTHPPAGATIESTSSDFPYPFTVTSLDLPSLFASKLGTVFDTGSEKGRHWFDFAWYINKKIPLNLALISAIIQPDSSPISMTQLVRKLATLIRSIDWKSVRKDVHNFLPPAEQETLDLWSEAFFLGHLESLMEYQEAPQNSIASLIADGKGKTLVDAVNKALSEGADANDDTRNGHRPLQMALRKEYSALAEILINHGADVNHRDRSGLTPLQTAVNNSLFETAKLSL